MCLQNTFSNFFKRGVFQNHENTCSEFGQGIISSSPYMVDSLWNHGIHFLNVVCMLLQIQWFDLNKFQSESESEQEHCSVGGVFRAALMRSFGDVGTVPANLSLKPLCTHGVTAQSWTETQQV